MYEKETWKEHGKTEERRRYISVWLKAIRCGKFPVYMHQRQKAVR